MAGVKICLVGASAFGCHLDDFGTKTQDLDLTLAVDVANLASQMAGIQGWTLHPRNEHQYETPHKVKVDLLPTGGRALQTNELIWPVSGFRMNLTGYRLIEGNPRPHPLAPGLDFPVANLEVLLLLKIVAYLDRPRERRKDLTHIGYILENGIGVDDELRYEGPASVEPNLDYFETGPFILGRQLAPLLNADERTIVDRFLAKVEDDGDPEATQAYMVSQAPSAWRRAPDELIKRIVGFKRGLG
jgi:predicted nucleotidyltransferase